MADSTATSKTPMTLENESFILMGKDVIEVLGLECGICKELFDHGKRLPKSLPCRHTICLSCLELIVQKTGSAIANNAAFNIKCPLCQCELNQATVKTLPNDHRVISGLDRVSTAKVRCKNKCLKHNCQTLEKFCETCMSPVCVDCIVLYHDEEDGHTIVDVKKAVGENTSQFDEMERKCSARLRQMAANMDMISHIQTHLGKRESKEINRINQQFQEYSKVLTQRQEELVNMVKEKIKQRKSEINSETLQLEESRKQLRALYDCFKDSRESGDVCGLFKMWKKFNEEEDKKAISFSEEQLCRSFQFTALNEERLKSDVGCLGDVHAIVDRTMQWPS